MVEDGVPTLYLANGAFLENAAAQGARWYPIPADFQYQRPIYVGLAPTWADYTAMGWYPGMVYNGGMWGYRPGISFAWMPGFHVSIGGRYYRDYGAYRSYYTSMPTNRYYTRTVYNNYSPRRGSSWGIHRGVSGGHVR